jgi:hypothetical protein
MVIALLDLGELDPRSAITIPRPEHMRTRTIRFRRASIGVYI